MDGANRRILIVDDDPSALALLQRRLGAEGFETVLAEDGQVALAEVARRQPDLMILDIMMPRLSGFDVIRSLRGRPETARLPVIAISAQGRALTKGLADEERPNAFFPKPIDFRDLIAEVTSLLDGPSPTGGEHGAHSGGGRVVAFIGAKGGVGTTTLAVNLAVGLANARWQTTFVETAAFHGTAATALGLTATRRLDALPLATPNALTPAAVAAALQPHPSGLRVLFGPSGSQAPPPADGVISLLDALRAQSHCLILDLDGAVDIFSQVALRLADRVCVVTHPEAPSVERAAALLRMVEGWGLRPESLLLVVNRSHPAQTLTAHDIAQRTGKPVSAELPPAAAACFDSAVHGRLLLDHPRADPIRQALTGLTRTLFTSARPAAIV